MEVLRIAPQVLLFEKKDPAHYQIRRRLGEGGFGEVFEAWDTKLCRSVALKRLKPMSASLRPDRLVEEGRLAASLKHTAFVQIYSIDGDGDAQSIIMELIHGATLHQFAQSHAPTEKIALSITLQIAEAMEEAHASSLVHGDIKPSNLMIDASGKVRILDFGLARQIDPLATESTIPEDTQGTIAYMAPERLLGDTADQQSDIYSLGVVLYELIAGRRPFPHLTGLALAAAHIQSSSESWLFPAGTEPAVVALVRAMTARDVAQRAPSMRIVCERIRSIGDDAGRHLQNGEPLPPSAFLARWVSHARLLAARRAMRAVRRWSIGAALVLLLGGFGLWHLERTGQLGKLLATPYSEAAAMRAGLDELRLFDRDGSVDSAIQNFTGVLERNPQQAAAAAGLSLAYSLRYATDGRDEVWLQRADASAQQALNLNDQLALAYAAQAWVKDYHGRVDDALLAANRALRLDPLNLFALRGKANTLISARRFDEAEQCIQSAIAAYPRERLFADLLGTLRYQQGKYQAAEQAFRHSISLTPDAVVAYANLNAALLRQDRGDEALQVLQQGLQIRPNGKLYGNLGTALFARGDYVAAAQAFEHAVSADRGSPNLYLNWANLADTLRWIPGRSKASTHAYQRAVELIEPLLKRSPTDATLLSRIGLYSAKLGDPSAVVSWTRRAVSAAPSSADVHFRAAIAYEITADRDAALAELAQAKSLGYPINLINSEPDLLALRRDARYHTPP